jgi:FkbM family methyltransferase
MFKLFFKYIYNFFYLKLKKIFLLLRKYHSLSRLDIKMLKYINYNNGYFIELGANDGISQSNTFFFERYKNWKGLLIEPIPSKYLECKKNRSIKNFIFNNACVSFGYRKKFVKMIYSNLMTTSLNLENDINPSKHIRLSRKFLKNNEKTFHFSAKAITLNKLLKKSGAPKVIDFMSIDVEGSEIEVLKGIDFFTYNFKYILVESRNIKKINTFFLNKNYILKKKLSHHDYLYTYEEKKI